MLWRNLDGQSVSTNTTKQPVTTIMKTIVTDGELGKLAVKYHELFTRVKKGVLPINQVLDALQSVIEGRNPVIIPTLNPNVGYKVWKTIRIGGVERSSLIESIEQKRGLDQWARDIMKQKAFTTLPAEESADLIVLTPADLGFTEMPTTTELFSRWRLESWGEKNLGDGYVLELNPSEVGPHLWEQYEDQPNAEILWVAMDQIAVSDGRPNVFIVERRVHGRRWLRSGYAGPDIRWNLNTKILFRLRNKNA